METPQPLFSTGSRSSSCNIWAIRRFRRSPVPSRRAGQPKRQASRSVSAMTLKAYMVLLATDLDKLSEFVADSRQAAERAGLSRDDQDVLFSGDQNLIYKTV